VGGCSIRYSTTSGRCPSVPIYPPRKGTVRDATQPLDVAPGRLAEELLILSVEVRRIVITHAVSRARDIDLAAQ